MTRTARCLGGPCDGTVRAGTGPTLHVTTPKSMVFDGSSPFVKLDRHEYRFQKHVLADGTRHSYWMYAGIIRQDHVGKAVGGPLDGKMLRSKLMRLIIPDVSKSTGGLLGRAVYEWRVSDQTQCAWVYVGSEGFSGTIEDPERIVSPGEGSHSREETQMKSRAKVSVVITMSEKRDENDEVVRVEREQFRGRLLREKADASLVVAEDSNVLPLVVGKVPSREAVLRIPAVYEATKGLNSEELEVSILVQPFPA